MGLLEVRNVAAAKKDRFGAGREVGWLIMVVGALGTIIVTGTVVRDHMRGKQGPFKLFVCDEHRVARGEDLIVRTPGGDDVCPNSNGEIPCLPSWSGKPFEIYQREPRRLLMTVTVVREEGQQTVPIEVPREKRSEASDVGS
jgi:hypothetical protein